MLNVFMSVNVNVSCNDNKGISAQQASIGFCAPYCSVRELQGVF